MHIYMLDTNVIIDMARKKPNCKVILDSMLKHKPEDMCLSAISYAELCTGIEKSGNSERNKLALSYLLTNIDILPFMSEDAEVYGRVRANLESRGTPIGDMDTLIAAHALAWGLTVITHNTKDFARVEGLKIEDWSM